MGGGGGRGGWVGGGGGRGRVGGCREGSGWGVRVGVIDELKFLGKFTQKNSRGRSVWGGGGVRVGERRIEVFVKIQKKNWGGGGRGRVGLAERQGGDVNEELKFL